MPDVSSAAGGVGAACAQKSATPAMGIAHEPAWSADE